MKLGPALLLFCLMAVSSARAQLGDSCSTVAPGSNLQCCKTKVAEGTADSWCSDTYPELYPDGSSCGTVTPGTEKECCEAKIADGQRDAWCEQNYSELYPVADSCGTVTSGYRRKCCRTKLANGEEADDWCKENYAELYAPPGSTCLSVNPADLEKCCADKAAAGTADETCPAPPGSTCASVNPVDFDKCCADKAEEGTADATCPSTPLAPGNYADFPYMAYIESPAAPNGTCGGALVAPGYVLTAAQCVFKGGEAADAADVKVWVDGKQYTVEAVLVDTDNAQFAEFQNPKSENSWDIAMLALANNSDAKYAALPLADLPVNGDWINTSAWKDAGSNVETAMVPAWDGCAPGWADEFCAGGSGFLQACPSDKGSPAMSSNTLVGITSGPGCDGTAANYGYFVKLADKDILQQITVWLNNRGTVGQDENIQNWLIEANTYLYGK